MDEAKYISAMISLMNAKTGMARSSLQWHVLQPGTFGSIIVPITMPDIHFPSCLYSDTKGKNKTTSSLSKKLLDFGELEKFGSQRGNLILSERIQVVSDRILNM